MWTLLLSLCCWVNRINGMNKESALLLKSVNSHFDQLTSAFPAYIGANFHQFWYMPFFSFYTFYAHVFNHKLSFLMFSVFWIILLKHQDLWGPNKIPTLLGKSGIFDHLLITHSEGVHGSTLITEAHFQRGDIWMWKTKHCPCGVSESFLLFFLNLFFLN